MSRDLAIQRTFETADDSLHGIIGYHLYTIAMQKAVDEQDILRYLPEKSFQTTFSWIRYYNKEQLTKAFEPPCLELYQCKIQLVALTSIFEALLSDFIKFLQTKGFIKTSIRDSYKSFIEWAYSQSLKANIGEKAALERLPISFGIIDNARRLRNLFTHNNGLFNKRYEKDAMRKNGIVVDVHPFYKEYEKNPRKKVPVVMDWRYFNKFILAHIEALHILHNQIQSEFFGVSEGYSYVEEGKPIDFRRVLWGNVNVRLKI